MKSKKIFLISLFLTVSILLSACASGIYSSTSWHGLNADSTTVYLAAGTQVYAVDVNSGTEKWRYPAKANAKITFYANPVLTPDEQLLVPSYDKNLYSLDPATGTEKYIYTGSTNRLIGSPLIIQNTIYQPSSDNHVYSWDLTTHKPGKTFATGGPLWAQPTTIPNCGCVIVPSMDHKVYSFDITSGNLLWQTDDLGGSVVGTPAVSADGVLYVGTFGSEMIALDGSNGKVKWRFSTQDWVWSGPALENNVLYFGDLAGYFYAVNTADGTQAWRIQPQNSIVATPVVQGDKIYFTTESDTFFIVSTTGNIESSQVVGGLIYSSPVIAGESILLTPTNFTSLLVALQLNGAQKWTYTPAKK